MNIIEHRDFSDTKIAIVIPSLNGAERIKQLIPRLSFLQADILIVNDGSNRKHTNEYVSIAASYTNTHIVHLKKNYGQRIASIVGLAFAIQTFNSKYLITIDDDGQHPPEIIPKMILSLERKPLVDLVYASPQSAYTRNPIRRFGSICNQLLFQKALHLPSDISVGSFRAIRYQLAFTALQKKYSYPYLSAMLIPHCRSISQVQYTQQKNSNTSPAPSRQKIYKLVTTWLAIFFFWGPFQNIAKFVKAKKLFNPYDYIGKIDEK